MQKKLIALAVAGLVSGGAFAQSNVTIDGILDGSVYINRATGSGSTYGMASNNASSSQFAFRGTEDLGSGLKAFFNLIEEINLLTGGSGSGSSGATTTGFNNFSRGANIGLSGNFGRLTVGRQPVPVYMTFGNLDPYASSTGRFFNSGTILTFWGLGTIMGGPSRLTGLTVPLPSNTSGGALLPNSFAAGLGYTTPRFSGFNVHLFSTFGQNLTGAPFNDGGQQDIALVYNNGTFGAVLDRNSWRTKVAATATGVFPSTVIASKTTTAGVNYTAGPMRLVGSWFKQTYDPTLAATMHDLSAWGVGGNYYFGAIRYGVAYTAMKDDIVSANKGSMLSVMADYQLSKRTDIYAILPYVRNKGAASLQGLWGGNTLNLTPGSSLNAQGGSSTSLALGMRVSF